MRTTKIVSISVPPADLEIAERLASEQYWQQVQAVARPKADALGIAEGDIPRLVDEYRKES